MVGVEVELDGGLGLLPGVVAPPLLGRLLGVELGGWLGIGAEPGPLFCWL